MEETYRLHPVLPPTVAMELQSPATQEHRTPDRPDARAPARVRCAASYARKSDPNGDGIATQHEINRRHASKLGFVIPDDLCFSDDDTTGVLIHRKAFDRLLALAESGEAPFEAVVVRNKKRFGRFDDPGMHDFYRIHLQRHGVQLLMVEGPIPDYTRGVTPEVAVASMWDRMDGISASQERMETRGRVITGVRRAVCRGFYPGTTAPYGTERWLADKYTRQAIQRVPDGVRLRTKDCAYRLLWASNGSVAAVREAFRLVDEEECSFEEVARRLAAAGFPPPARPTTRKKDRGSHGAPRWTAPAVRYILQNPIYAGDLVWGRMHHGQPPVPHDRAELNGEGPILYRRFMADPPVPSDRFDRVQAILKGRRARGRGGKQPVEYLLSGQIRCAKCSGPWYGFTSGRGARRRYYRHQQGSQGFLPPEVATCVHRNRYLRAAEMERLVIRGAFAAIQLDGFEAQLRAEVHHRLELLQSPDHQTRIERLEAQQAHQEREIDRIIRERGQITSVALLKRYEQVLGDLARELEATEIQLAGLRTQQRDAELALDRHSAALAGARSLLEVFDVAPSRQQRAILSELLESIRYDPTTQHVEVRVRMPPAS